jgi:hypothetical protein
LLLLFSLGIRFTFSELLKALLLVAFRDQQVNEKNNYANPVEAKVEQKWKLQLIESTARPSQSKVCSGELDQRKGDFFANDSSRKEMKIHNIVTSGAHEVLRREIEGKLTIDHN